MRSSFSSVRRKLYSSALRSWRYTGSNLGGSELLITSCPSFFGIEIDSLQENLALDLGYGIALGPMTTDESDLPQEPQSWVKAS